MIKVVTIIGARPQIIKASALSRSIYEKYSNNISEIIVHTGQHYDYNMSAVFFDELGIPKPNYNLEVGSSSHGEQTALMIKGIEEILVKEQPNCMVVYGDTNSTLAGAIAGSKIHIPIVHIEAGLRSFNKKMPEEINRITCDHCSTLLFSPTYTGLKNLLNEGFKSGNEKPYTIDNPGVYHNGDVMYDNSLHFSEVAKTKESFFKENDIEKENYILSTIHRQENTDDSENLNNIFDAINELSVKHKIQVVIPLHPRTKKLIESNLEKELYNSLLENKLIKIIEPVSFLEMILLEKNSKLIMTDSGGVQKEAYFFEKPCVVFRNETEWVELVKLGTAELAGTNSEKIINAYESLTTNTSLSFPQIFGNGKTAEFICAEMINAFEKC